MSKLLASIILAASFAAPSVALAGEATDYDKQLDIVSRYNKSTIQADVELSQGRVGVEIQLVGATPDQTARLRAAFLEKVRRNMGELRKFVTCVEKPELCSVVSPK